MTSFSWVSAEAWLERVENLQPVVLSKVGVDHRLFSMYAKSVEEVENQSSPVDDPHQE